MTAQARPVNSATAKARAAWGESLPDWIAALAEVCDKRGTQRAVADLLDVSPALVCLALSNKHHAALDYIKARVEARLMISIIPCPVRGMISRQDCEREQARPLITTNPERVRLYRACHGGCKYYQPTTLTDGVARRGAPGESEAGASGLLPRAHGADERTIKGGKL